MRLYNRLFTYPVLRDALEPDYYDGDFSFFIEKDQSKGNKRFTFSVEITVPEINNLIIEGVVSVVVHVECPFTSFRDVVYMNGSHCEYDLPEGLVAGQVEICAFIVAEQPICDFSSDLFSIDLRGLKFDFEPGYRLAEGVTYVIEVDNSDFAANEGVINIIASEKARRMEIDLNSNKILIALPEETNKQYARLKQAQNMQPVIFSAIIFPALVYCLEIIREDMGKGESSYGNNTWYLAIVHRLAVLGTPLDTAFHQSNSIELAQLILEDIVSEATTNLLEMQEGSIDG